VTAEHLDFWVAWENKHKKIAYKNVCIINTAKVAFTTNIVVNLKQVFLYNTAYMQTSDRNINNEAEIFGRPT